MKTKSIKKPTPYKSAKSNKKSLSHNYNFELYPEWNDITDIITTLNYLCDYYAFILHDKDIKNKMRVNNLTGEINDSLLTELKKPHIHYYGHFTQSHSIEQIINKVNSLNLKSNLIEPTGDVKATLRYWLHLDNPDKYQYDITEIHTNNKKRYLIDIQDKRTIESQKIKLIQFINESLKNNVYIDFIDLSKYAYSTGCESALNSQQIKEYLKAYHSRMYKLNKR